MSKGIKGNIIVRFNRDSNRKILESLIKDQQDKQERVDKLANKFKKKEVKVKKKFVSDCENEYEFCESRLKYKK